MYARLQIDRCRGEIGMVYVQFLYTVWHECDGNGYTLGSFISSVAPETGEPKSCGAAQLHMYCLGEEHSKERYSMQSTKLEQDWQKGQTLDWIGEAKKRPHPSTASYCCLSVPSFTAV